MPEFTVEAPAARFATEDPQTIEGARVKEFVIALAATIDTNVPRSRDKSLALTALEDVLIRSLRALA